MNKKKLKKISIVILSLIISLDSFAAIVSDNDGSAFITKAEFDSLKNDFQSQLNGYNTGIDSKIDTAIASYLAGINVGSQVTLNLLYPVLEDETYKPKSVKNKENTIKKQTFQGGLYYTAHWATWGNGPQLSSDFMPWASSDYNFTQFAFNAKGYYDQMEGWVFDKDNPTVLTKKYGYDNCSLILSDTISMNNNYGNAGAWGDEGADRWSMGIQPGTLTGKRIDTNYDSPSGIGNGESNWGCGTLSHWIASTITPAIAKAHWLDVLPMDSAFANGSGHGEVKNNTYMYSEYVWNIQYMISHSVKDEDYNIYVYPYCKDVIYAHASDANTLEEYRDYMNDVPAANVIGGEYTNLFLTDKTDRWMYWQRESEGSNARYIHPRRLWRFTPKFKLKNTYSVVAPNTASVSGGTKYWNTLDQFKNGHIVYKDHTGTITSPHFYGGLPIIAITSDYQNFSFDIKLLPTINLSESSFCIRIMSEEFPNGNDISTWTSSQKSALLKVSGSSKNGSEIVKYEYDDTNKYLIIPKNTNITITIDRPTSNKTYFLRWWEQSNLDNAGGQIEFLGNGIATKEN